MPSAASLLKTLYPEPQKSGKCVDCTHFECCPGDDCGWGICRLGLSERPAEVFWVFGDDMDVCDDDFKAVGSHG